MARVKAVVPFDQDPTDKLSEPERLHLLRVFDELMPRIPFRDHCEVERELKSIRQARRAGVRNSPDKFRETRRA